jgi:two-component system copper resistance phosphate regulon response regulator CusR
MIDMRKTAVSSSDIRQRILIIEDDRRMMKMLEDGIAGEGYQVETAGTAEEGFFLVHRFRPDLLVLDLHLPNRSGMEILKQIRIQGTDVRVIGLEAGADDYLGKPFSFPELLARIRTLLRRRPVAAAQNAVEVADLSLDTNARVARRAGRTLDLTTREFDLLLFLAEHQNQTVSREMLARDVWQENARFTPIDNVIDVQMNRLRRKVDDPFESKLLHTIRGIGFILKEPSA